MNFIQAIEATPNTVTANGAAAFTSTASACLDFFGQAGSMRGEAAMASALFAKAYQEDPQLAVRISLWLRDIREGAGEREAFRTIFSDLVKSGDDQALFYATIMLIKVANDLGRWDDVLIAMDTPLEVTAISMIRNALDNGNQLCAKWMPREKSFSREIKKAKEKGLSNIVAKYREKAKENNQWVAILAKKLGFLGTKQYRQCLSQLTDVVESKMAKKDYSEVNYNHVPSIAASRYQKAFMRNDEVRYKAYVESLVKGEAKINAGAIYPHTVVQSAHTGNDVVASAQWAALPDYLPEGVKVLPMVDVSGSMCCRINGDTKSSTECIDVALALGMYLAERNKSVFKDTFLTFSTHPEFVKIEGKMLSEKLFNMARANWSMSTNLEGALQKILMVAQRGSVSQEDMPDALVILSDMQFNQASKFGQTLFERCQELYSEAGYKMPQVVFWNLNGKTGNVPVTKHDSGVALVSGFSPSLMSSVLGGKNPVEAMLEVVGKARYDLHT